MAINKRSDPKKPAPNPGPDNKLDSVLLFLARFQRFAWDVAGILILALSLMTLLALPAIPGFTGGLLAGWAAILRAWLGFGSIFTVLVGGVAGLIMLRYRNGETLKINWYRVFALEAAVFSFLILSAMIGGTSLDRAEIGLDGGRIGWGLAELLQLVLGSIGIHNVIWGYAIVGFIFFISCLYGLGLSKLINLLIQKIARMGESSYQPTEADPAISVAPIGEPESPTTAGSQLKKKQAPLPAEFRKKFRVQVDEENSAPPPPRDEHLPPLDLLVSEQSTRPDERSINQTAGNIEKTLSEFGIPAKVIGFKVGPTVTQFAVEPGFVDKGINEDGDAAARQKVRVAQISSLQRDLALALSAERLRIEAPVPGRPYIGIEVPNARSSVVRLRPILENEAFYKVSSPLAIALGRDVSGQPVVADLTSMPHLLIAGTTGSGKSVCIAALTACLVMNNTPEELRLVMIDPKMVELVRFNGLPHLWGKVETDIERILGVLHWIVAEMDRRYKLLEAMHARHLESYNRKMRRRKGGQTLPRIVLMIDELADLMMSAPEQTEPAIVRLAQLARATGIHLVVATQRPSTDVVTGLIKANFPARLSFAVASSIDSRVILDTVGAESLLGKGDMLFMPPEASAPIRAQGVIITDQEVERLITFWQKAHPAVKGEIPPWEEMLKQEEVLADKDDLVMKAVAIVRDTQRCSASMIQRRLRIGYPRAARLVDELEEMGIVGPSLGGGREREVLIEPGDADPRENVEFDEDNEE
jgi:S-DNA-T family DNA segregation ATPase FtsK/SpoIIIE